MISIRFKDYLMDKQSFDRLFKHSASPLQSKPFESLAEALLDIGREFNALQASARSGNAEEQMKGQKALMEFIENYITLKSYKAAKRSSIEPWLRLPVEDFAILKKHKVIED